MRECQTVPQPREQEHEQKEKTCPHTQFILIKRICFGDFLNDFCPKFQNGVTLSSIAAADLHDNRR